MSLAVAEQGLKKSSLNVTAIINLCRRLQADLHKKNSGQPSNHAVSNMKRKCTVPHFEYRILNFPFLYHHRHTRIGVLSKDVNKKRSVYKQL